MVPAASSPYSCATSAEQGKEKWTKLKVCHFQNQLCSNPHALAKTEKKKRLTNTNSEELNPHYNNFFFSNYPEVLFYLLYATLHKKSYEKYSSSFALESVYSSVHIFCTCFISVPKSRKIKSTCVQVKCFGHTKHRGGAKDAVPSVWQEHLYRF